MKYVPSLTTETKQTLEEMLHNHPFARCRQRAQAILLSARGYTVPQITEILEVERKAICRWIDQWHTQGLLGLYDKPRPGRPPLLTAEDTTLLQELIDKEPRQMKKAHIELQKITGKQASCYTLKRILKNSTTVGNAVVAR
jgi:transposase